MARICAVHKERELRDAIASPKFSHARAGNGLYRGTVLVYHFDENSPSNFRLAAVGDETFVDRLIREAGRPAAISPTEPR
jgi:hypothetical protein